MKIASTMLGLTLILLASRAFAEDAVQLEPHLVAISVPDVGASITWYQEHLGFELTSRDDYPDHRLSIAMMARGGFRLELIQHGDAIPPASVLPDKTNPATLHGVVKIAFWVAEVGAMLERFREAEATFVMEPRIDEAAGTLSFTVLDVSGNWVQFFGRATATDVDAPE